MNKYDSIIADMYPTMKKYLPRLSSYLMDLYSTEPTRSCERFNHLYVGLILYSFCNFFKYDAELSKAYNYAHENLSQEEFTNKCYLSFTDGKLYDKTYNPMYLYSLIDDAAISFNLPLIEIEQEKPEETEIFIGFIIRIINHLSSKTDLNSDLYCAEYLEQCFLTSLKKNLEIYFEYKDSLKNL